jgi:monofunctional biosynthetic peptidoglycan transglycosylase
MLRRALLVLAAAVFLAAAAFWATLPDVGSLATDFPKSTAFMEIRRAELRRQGMRAVLEYSPVPLSRISSLVQRAVVEAEDARFYEHAGIDWDAVRGAAHKDWRKREPLSGGSTLTQQLAKNLYLSPARTPWRKLREWAIARRLEARLSKKRILELYLNVIELGPKTYGVEAAARRYFGKPAANLSAREAAMIAAIIPSPRIYDPVRHRDRVERRAARILRRLKAADK